MNENKKKKKMYQTTCDDESKEKRKKKYRGEYCSEKKERELVGSNHLATIRYTRVGEQALGYCLREKLWKLRAPMLSRAAKLTYKACFRCCSCSLLRHGYTIAWLSSPSLSLTHDLPSLLFFPFCCFATFSFLLCLDLYLSARSGKHRRKVKKRGNSIVGIT